MDFEATVEDLVRAIGRAAIVVERKTENVLLTNLKLEVWKTSASGKVVGSSLIMSAGCRFQASVKKEGAVAVDQQRLQSILSKLPAGKQVRLRQNGEMMEVRCGSSKYQLNALGGEDFPRAPKPPTKDILKVRVETLLELIRSTESGMLNDDQRAHLSGALFDYNSKRAIMVTTDARRLIKYTLPFSGNVEGAIFIPYKAVLALKKFCETLEMATPIEFVASNTHVFFWNAVAGFSCRLVEVKKMDYDRAVPTQLTTKAIIQRGKLMDALGRLKVITDGPVRVFADTEADKLEITSANPSAGTGREVLKGTVKGRDGEIVLSSSHMLEFLAVVRSEKVRLEFTNGDKPALLQPVKDVDLFAVLLPLVDNR